MKNEFVTYEIALALKELGFNEPCFGYYYTLDGKDWDCVDKTEFYRMDDEMHIGTNFQLIAPLRQQAFRWFREKYTLLGFIEPANGYEDKSLFAFYVCDDEQNSIDDSHSYTKDSSLHFKTYEKAETACLEKLIIMSKTNKL